jgi:hypothetical protein
MELFGVNEIFKTNEVSQEDWKKEMEEGDRVFGKLEEKFINNIEITEEDLKEGKNTLDKIGKLISDEVNACCSDYVAKCEGAPIELINLFMVGFMSDVSKYLSVLNFKRATYLLLKKRYNKQLNIEEDEKDEE